MNSNNSTANKPPPLGHVTFKIVCTVWVKANTLTDLCMAQSHSPTVPQSHSPTVPQSHSLLTI